MSIPYTLTNFLDGLSWWLTEPGMSRDLNLGTYQDLAKRLRERENMQMSIHLSISRI